MLSTFSLWYKKRAKKWVFCEKACFPLCHYTAFKFHLIDPVRSSIHEFIWITLNLFRILMLEPKVVHFRGNVNFKFCIDFWESVKSWFDSWLPLAQWGVVSYLTSPSLGLLTCKMRTKIPYLIKLCQLINGLISQYAFNDQLGFLLFDYTSLIHWKDTV